jgi:hypothetical protein
MTRVLLYIYRMSHNPGPLENSVIWQNMEKRKEGKVVENHVFPISSVGIFYLGRAVTALRSLHYQR